MLLPFSVFTFKLATMYRNKLHDVKYPKVRALSYVRRGEKEVILDGGYKLGNDSSITRLPSSPKCKGASAPPWERDPISTLAHCNCNGLLLSRPVLTLATRLGLSSFSARFLGSRSQMAGLSGPEQLSHSLPWWVWVVFGHPVPGPGSGSRSICLPSPASQTGTLASAPRKFSKGRLRF